MLANFEFSQRRLPTRMNAHPTGPKGAQRLIQSAILFHPSLNEDKIGFLDQPVFKEKVHMAMGGGIFGEKNNAARPSVEAVNHKNAPAQLPFKFTSQGFPRRFPASRNHQLAGGFSHRNHLGILVKDLDRHKEFVT